jgi:hypothetical protein
LHPRFAQRFKGMAERDYFVDMNVGKTRGLGLGDPYLLERGISNATIQKHRIEIYSDLPTRVLT